MSSLFNYVLTMSPLATARGITKDLCSPSRRVGSGQPLEQWREGFQPWCRSGFPNRPWTVLQRGTTAVDLQVKKR